jgi:NAD(P)-dependent dehydrogenase (short-subunit alcohol dehydrogenase family)
MTRRDPYLIPAAALLGAAALAVRWLNTAKRYSFRGKSVLITGGARGLGLILARMLAAEGARLAIVGRTSDALRDAALELRAKGARVQAWPCDVRDPREVAAAVQRVVDDHGRIDVLINNAGVIEATPLEHATAHDYDRSLETHFWGPFHTMQAALPHMRRAGTGRILNISSVGGRLAIPHLNPYSVGKAALVALSEGVRAETAKDGIVVTTATPGLMRTGSHARVDVRGHHRREAQWFGAMVASPLTSMNAERAARQILEACRRGRAQVTPGFQARAAVRANALAPELVAAIMSGVVRWLLPGPTNSTAGDVTRRAHEIPVGWIGALFPKAASARNNELPAR